MPEFTIEDVYGDEIATVELPEKLPASVGDEAERKLNVQVEGKQQGNMKKAEATIGSKEFTEVRTYLARTMLEKYTDREWDFDEVAADSVSDVAGYYFDRMALWGGSKKNEDE